jgi:excinuclease UvrABC nuclease subunit
MPRPDDHGYYSRRAADEVERGNRAANAAIAAIHYELAQRYSRLAAKSGMAPPKLTPIDGGKRQIAA